MRYSLQKTVRNVNFFMQRHFLYWVSHHLLQTEIRPLAEDCHHFHLLRIDSLVSPINVRVVKKGRELYLTQHHWVHFFFPFVFLLILTLFKVSPLAHFRVENSVISHGVHIPFDCKSPASIWEGSNSINGMLKIFFPEGIDAFIILSDLIDICIFWDSPSKIC